MLCVVGILVTIVNFLFSISGCFDLTGQVNKLDCFKLIGKHTKWQCVWEPEKTLNISRFKLLVE